ncbi:hypothetical protein SCAR479_06127 [Seiridium cardinale]|uniref:Rhodopsin domain-containing protein n=1 Tax=Seiridium cardinale TaxID=138064 RepID=A0ABR2XTB6_9PEZI
MSSPVTRDGNTVSEFVDPTLQLNLGLWFLFVGATLLLTTRVWIKITRAGLWYDDYILIASWGVLLANDALISYEYATGYVSPTGDWDQHMHILINVSSCGTLVGQAWSKTALGVTLLRMSGRLQTSIIWWAKVCDGTKDYQASYRLNFCIYADFRDDFKEGGQIVNIIMDFLFALFPWWITWRLNLKKMEKVALCATMSLGMVVAVIAAIRTAWKDDGNKHNPWYYWHNAMSNIWYSSEVAGTIMVQCIPVLRPLLKEMGNSLTSRKLASTEDQKTAATWQRFGYEAKFYAQSWDYTLLLADQLRGTCASACSPFCVSSQLELSGDVEWIAFSKSFFEYVITIAAVKTG